MAAQMVDQFHARDAEGRVYPVQAFQSAAATLADGTPGEPAPLVYRLAIGDRVNHLGDDRFELVGSGIEIVRVP